MISLLFSYICCAQISSFRGIGAVVYKVPELENDHMLKISLRSVGNEDTTPISQVVPLSSWQVVNSIVYMAFINMPYYLQLDLYLMSFSLLLGIWRWWTSKCQLFHAKLRRIWAMEGVIGCLHSDEIEFTPNIWMFVWINCCSAKPCECLGGSLIKWLSYAILLTIQWVGM